jgi:hypothetical protein
MDLEEMEVGVIADAWKTLKSSPQLARAILGRVLIFIALYSIWSFHQVFFVEYGVSILILGIAWSLGHAVSFVAMRQIQFFATRNLSTSINLINVCIALCLGALAVSLVSHVSIYIALVLFMLADHLEIIRLPLYAEYFNLKSKSFNRATTLSLVNFSKSVLDIPLLFVGSILVGMDYRFAFVFSAVIAGVVVVFFRLSRSKQI